MRDTEQGVTHAPGLGRQLDAAKGRLSAGHRILHIADKSYRGSDRKRSRDIKHLVGNIH
jgi:hypothetical protein